MWHSDVERERMCVGKTDKNNLTNALQSESTLLLCVCVSITHLCINCCDVWLEYFFQNVKRNCCESNDTFILCYCVQVKGQDTAANEAHDCSWWPHWPYTSSEVLPAATAAEIQVGQQAYLKLDIFVCLVFWISADTHLGQFMSRLKEIYRGKMINAESQHAGVESEFLLHIVLLVV